MLFPEAIEIGDSVIIDVPESAMSQGYQPRYPNGTIAKVSGFSPDGDLDAYDSDGNVWIHLSANNCVFSERADCLTMVDGYEYNWRVERKRQINGPKEGSGKSALDYIGNLPWVGDLVTLYEPTGNDFPLLVAKIDYAHLIDPKTPIYTIAHCLEGKDVISVNRSQIKTLERGNLWQHFHRENYVVELNFRDIWEEAEFYRRLGLPEVIEMRNPANGLLGNWSKEEIKIFLEKGYGDYYTGGIGPCNSTFNSVFRFRDAEFGKRIRQAILDNHLL